MKKKTLSLALVCVMVVSCLGIVAMAASENAVGSEANDGVSGYSEVEVKSDEVFVGTPDMRVASVAGASQK